MAPGHAKELEVISIPVFQSFMSPSEYILHLKIECGIKLDHDVEAMIRRLDFRSSFQKKFVVVVIGGSQFPNKTSIIGTKKTAKALGLKNSDAVMVCLLYDYLIQHNSSEFDKFTFMIAPHKAVDGPSVNNPKFNEFAFLSINNGENATALRVYFDEPIAGVAHISKEDAVIFVK